MATKFLVICKLDNSVTSNKKLGGATSHQCELSHLIDELVESELDYINDLRLCQEAYIEPLSRSFDVSNIFMKWDQLIQLHELAMLRILSSTSFENGSRTIDEYRFILEVFHDLLNSLVEVYIQVCSHQRESTRFYEAFLVSDIRFKQLVSDCQRNTSKMLERQLVDSSDNQQTKEAKRDKYRALSSIKLPLTNFLLKPMQRITKYSLIFDRILKVINQSGPKELENLVRGLKLSAQTLCEKVNEACRSKEDNEDNKSKLQWAQSHIKQQSNLQQQQSLPSPSTTDLSSLESKHFILSCVSQESLRTKDVNSLPSSASEYIIFDSKTNCLGERKFLKSGSFVKFKSGKELVLFLFNDLLLLTQVKGNSSSIRVEDVFQSTQAQQAYYKLYKPPILMEDIILLDQTAVTDDSRSIKKNSITDLQSQFVLTFSDKSNGIIYNLIPLNAQEKINWTKELSQRSTEAREARAEYQARQAALLFKPLSRKPSVSECVGRLFIGILEISQYYTGAGGKNSSIPSQNFIRSSGNYSSLNLRINSQNLLSSTSKVSIQLQLKRLKGTVDNIISYDEQTETTSNEGKDLIPISDIYSTKTVAINPSGYSLNTSTIDSSIGGSDSCAQLDLVRFSDEGTQFLIRKKLLGELEDFIDIGLFDEAKFRETKLIARKRVNLDQLIQQQLQPNLLIDQPVDLTSTSSYDQLKRPFDCVFKMRLLKSLHDQTNNNNRSSIMDNRRSRHFNETPKSLTSSMRQSTGISIRMRFHFQLFCDTD